MKSNVVICVFISWFLSIVSAYATTIDDVLALAEQADKGVSTMRFNFSQEIRYTLTNEKQVNNGEVMFQKPALLYMKQTKPLEQIIISNGKKVFIYTPTYQQAIEDDWKKWAQSSMVPASLLNFGKGWSDLKKKYQFSYVGTDKSTYVISMTPKASNQRNSMELMVWIDSVTGFPVRVQINGETISVSTIIDDQKVNVPIDPDIFKFKAPAGVEVLNINQ